jgi:hypothetical protein
VMAGVACGVVVCGVVVVVVCVEECECLWETLLILPS